jgi:hypothetical protein
MIAEFKQRWDRFWLKPETRGTIGTRIVNLDAGHLILTISASIFELSEKDREMIFGIVDVVESYEARIAGGHQSGTEDKQDA